MEPVRFYKMDAPYHEFSNFYPSSFALDGEVWPSAEHYFQAAKFSECPAYAALIREADSPLKVAALGRQRALGRYHTELVVNKRTNSAKVNDVIRQFAAVQLRSDWDDVKEVVMERALLAKFSQKRRLRLLLVGTGHAPIIEASPRDAYWGEGPDGTGQNRLGVVLMKVREQLSASPL